MNNIAFSFTKVLDYMKYIPKIENNYIYKALFLSIYHFQPSYNN
jgi:hypothetical protein